MSKSGSWRDFWNSEVTIFACDLHKQLHYALIARDVAPFVGPKNARILDHGCGEALGAEALAGTCDRLYLFDAAINVRRKLLTRLDGRPGIVVLEEDALEAIPDSSLDLVIASSLLQYLTLQEFISLLDLWRRKTPGCNPM